MYTLCGIMVVNCVWLAIFKDFNRVPIEVSLSNGKVIRFVNACCCITKGFSLTSSPISVVVIVVIVIVVVGCCACGTSVVVLLYSTHCVNSCSSTNSNSPQIS